MKKTMLSVIPYILLCIILLNGRVFTVVAAKAVKEGEENTNHAEQTIQGKVEKNIVDKKQEDIQEEYGYDLTDEYYDSFYNASGLDSLEAELSLINENYGMEQNISVSDLYDLLLEGKVNEALEKVMTGFCEGIVGEMSANRELLAKLFLLVIFAAVFQNYSAVFQFSHAGEQSFYITYLIFAVLLMQSFTLAYELAEKVVLYLNEVLKCLLPAFCMSLMLCSGITTSQMVNSMFIWMLTFVEKILLSVVLPAIRIYFVIILLNQINEKDRFSKLAGLLKQGVQFLLKFIVTGIIGLNIMKSLLVPVYENTKYSIFQKGLSAIPGGSTFTGLGTILMGAGVLIKNSVGITFVLVLAVLGGIPLLKLFCFYISYRIMLALIQPVSDKRILAGIQGTADSIGILLRATATSIVLSILTIAIVILTTNVRLYSG